MSASEPPAPADDPRRPARRRAWFLASCVITPTLSVLMSGLALGLAPDLAGTLAPGDQGSLILVLPEGGGRIELEAELRHRDRAWSALQTPPQAEER